MAKQNFAKLSVDRLVTHSTKLCHFIGSTLPLCKILNFPPKCNSVLGQLPLIYSTRGSYHLTEPPHKDTVLLCQGCPRPLQLCRGHQNMLIRARNLKFYRVALLESIMLHSSLKKIQATAAPHSVHSYESLVQNAQISL